MYSTAVSMTYLCFIASVDLIQMFLCFVCVYVYVCVCPGVLHHSLYHTLYQDLISLCHDSQMFVYALDPLISQNVVCMYHGDLEVTNSSRSCFRAFSPGPSSNVHLSVCCDVVVDCDV